MEKDFQKIKGILNEIDDAMKIITMDSFEQRARGLERAVNDGWFKHFLVGAALAGAGLVYNGTANDNNYETGVGYGILAMDSIYALGCYGLPALKRLGKVKKMK